MSESAVPQHPIDARVAPLDNAIVLTLERVLPATIPEIWHALTDRHRVAGWAPYHPSRDLTATGPVSLPESTTDDDDEEPPESQGEVLSVIPGRMLSLTWGDDTLDFEVVPSENATVLRLSHTFDDRDNAASYAAGWHLCLTALDGITQGLEIPPMTGEAAKLHGWDVLNEQYERLLR
ncbi:uncharacterized protein YndB with AHSA1/START domain [Okibacterium sp. HSC-33S16]|uniref:SRPBCC domain-containing protein n=1 Tax=Okibacterium sp. HSC-33S16 TaxID=2910965 RepID=UPI00209D482A|nr:SRPBCC domain-containing protein [Okibacterium sp. HSC-33S16]MCP2031374.1 uncharacterized protein YndB with AHSA1/START domain [Okibacterium sp. HSC-33S16]